MIFSLLFVLAALCGSSWASEEQKPKPYKFGYAIKDKESIQHRQEESDGHGRVHGTYGFIDNKGIFREVKYVADHNGFRAAIKTNEPGTTSREPANVKVLSKDPYTQGAGHPYNSKPNVPYVPALDVADGKRGLPTIHDFHKFKPGHDEEKHQKSNVKPVQAKKGDVVYFGTNLVGGKITGFDSRL